MSTLPYFPFYPGDYMADTADLSCCEHGVYMLLLAASWQRGPLTDNMDRLSRIVATPPIEVLRYILETYWVRTDQGWINARLEKERAKVNKTVESRRLAARKRWDANADANALQMESKRNDIHIQNHIQNQKLELENTKKKTNTSKTPRKLGGNLPLPSGLDAETWEQFRQTRIAMKAKMTEHAEKLLLNKLAKMDGDKRKIVEQSIERGWRGLFPVEPSSGNANKPRPLLGSTYEDD